MELSGKIKFLVIGAIIFLGGHLVGFTQGIGAAKSYDDINPPSSKHIIVQSCEDKPFVFPDKFPFLPAPPTEDEEKNTEPSQLKPLPRIETKL